MSAIPPAVPDAAAPAVRQQPTTPIYIHQSILKITKIIEILNIIDYDHEEEVLLLDGIEVIV